MNSSGCMSVTAAGGFHEMQKIVPVILKSEQSFPMKPADKSKDTF